MPTPVDNTLPPVPNQDVSVADAQEVIRWAGEQVYDARGSNGIVSRRELEAHLDNYQGYRRQLVDVFYRFVDHRDAGEGNRVTWSDIERTMAYAEKRLIERLDVDSDGALTPKELESASRIARLATLIASGATPVVDHLVPPDSFGTAVQHAIEKGWITLEESDNQITGLSITPTWSTDTSLQPLVEEVVRSPRIAKLESLTIGVLSEYDSHGDTYSSMINVLRRIAPLTHLKKVRIGDDDYQISWLDLSGSSEIVNLAPNLEEIRFTGAQIGFGGAHAKLKKLVIETGGLEEGVARRIARSKYECMEHLELWFGASEYGAGADIDELSSLWSGNNVPNLVTLGLKNSEFQNDIARELAKSEVASRIKNVDLSMGTMTDVGAQHLLDNASRLMHLETIDVSRNYLSDEMVQKLVAKFGPRIMAKNQGDAGNGHGRIAVFVHNPHYLDNRDKLSLVDDGMDDRGGQMLLDNAAIFEGMQTIDVSYNLLSADMITRLKARFGDDTIISRYQYPPGYTGHLYVSVGE